MKYTRAKKLVWQSSKLAPLVCEFGWAICVYGGKSGREVYARSHTHGTIHTHTHTQNAVCMMLNFESNYTPFSLNRTDCFPRRWASSWLATFLHFETHHTHTPKLSGRTHTHRHKLLLLLRGRLSPFLSHLVLVGIGQLTSEKMTRSRREGKIRRKSSQFHQQAMVSFGFLERRSTRRRNRDS
jgi:hypothetical protein